MTDATPRLGRADLHIHTLASDGTAGIEAILGHVERATDLDVIAITDHERIDAAVAARAIARDRGLRAEVIVGEEVTTLGGHLLGLYLDRPIRPYRSLRTTIAGGPRGRRPGHPGPSPGPYPLCAQGWVLRRPPRRPGSGRPPRRARDVQPDQPRQAVASSRRPLRRRPRPGPRRQQRRPRPRGDRAPAGRPSRAARRGPARAIETGTTEHGGTFHETAGQLGTFGNQLRKRGRDARDEVAGRVRRDGTGRDHGYPGGRLPTAPLRSPEPGSRERR